MNNKVFLFIFILFSSSFTAESDSPKEIYSFINIEDEQKFYSLLNTYRCPKCQSSNLAGSDSPIAKDLKREIHRLIKEGKTEEEIDSFLRSRYGEFILYKPALRENTLVLWVGPFFLFLLIVSVLIFRNLSSKRKKEDLEAEKIVKAIERTRLRSLIED